jgi:HIRAN domain-containing protein
MHPPGLAGPETRSSCGQATARPPCLASPKGRLVKPDRLFVIWRHPDTGTRHVIGELWREGDAYAFAYRPKLPFEEGFALLAEFPEHRVAPSAYSAPYLFPTFAQRVPSSARTDVGELFAALGVENPSDSLEVLARSGGVQTTDRLELAEYRADDDTLGCPLEMRIAGATHYEAGELQVGEPLELRREPDNQYDPHATFVVFKGQTKVGYVPRQYSKLISRLLDSGVKLSANAVRRLVLPPEGGRWVVRVSRI